MGVNRILFCAVGEADVKTVHLERGQDPFLDFADHRPYHLLFLDVQIVKSTDVPARGYHHMTVRQRIRVRHGNRILVDDPGFFGQDRAVYAGRQINTIARTNRPGGPGYRKAFSIAAMTSPDWGSIADSNLAFTWPSLPTRNFVKFHWISPPVAGLDCLSVRN